MILLVTEKTPRLEYIAGFAGNYLTGKPMQLVTSAEEFRRSGVPGINYTGTRYTQEEFWISPHPLLFQTAILPQELTCFDADGCKAFFPSPGDFPFDIFAAAFYLLSRYEEYLPGDKDAYGRYAHENALAYREGFLEKPLVNQWLELLKKKLREKFPGISFRENSFRFMPTYDIDEAFSYRYKSWWRRAGAGLRDILKGDFARAGERRKVIRGENPDPYDSFEWMHRLHDGYDLRPRFFFLVAGKNSRYDKNISPASPAFRGLARQLAEKYPVGIHPSWQSGDDPSLLPREKETMEEITGKKVIASRQHYIRFSLPLTFRRLLAAGVREDYSMGYGSINGFRASVAAPFYWYDLEKEETTELLLYPFCFMDANAYFEQKLTSRQALAEMQQYYHEVKAVGGLLCMIWHNTFLGTEKRFSGWREVYEKFIAEICQPGS